MHRFMFNLPKLKSHKYNCHGKIHFHASVRATPWSGGSVLEHRSLPSVFESRRGDIWRLFHLWLLFTVFRGRSAHLAYHMHKSGIKTPNIIFIHCIQMIQQVPVMNFSIRLFQSMLSCHRLYFFLNMFSSTSIIISINLPLHNSLCYVTFWLGIIVCFICFPSFSFWFLYHMVFIQDVLRPT